MSKKSKLEPNCLQTQPDDLYAELTAPVQYEKGDKVPGRKKLADEFVKQLEQIPVVYTHHAFEKGEMKVRITPGIAHLLRLLSEYCGATQPIPNLPENLINELLRIYFATHQSKIEAVYLQVENTRQSNRQQTLVNIKLLGK